MQSIDYEALYKDLLIKYDRSETQIAKLRQQIMMHSIETSTIREEKAWDAGFLIGFRAGLPSSCQETDLDLKNPLTKERKKYEGKKI